MQQKYKKKSFLQVCERNLYIYAEDRLIKWNTEDINA